MIHVIVYYFTDLSVNVQHYIILTEFIQIIKYHSFIIYSFISEVALSINFVFITVFQLTADDRITQIKRDQVFFRH